MKTVMLRFCLVLFVSGALFACSKGKEGPVGPEGNANVTMYTFENRTFTGSLNLTIDNLSKGKVDSSLVLVYYNPSTEDVTAWYSVPGIGSTSAYETRFFLFQSNPTPSTYTLGIRTLKLDGSAYGNAVTFRKIRVIIAPASQIVSGRGISGGFDYSDYNAVKAYFNIKD